MFSGFDPSLLGDPEFKEDSVREEIIVPILKRLGYSASGSNRIVRSKALLHPFVMIGSKKHPINIIPDYLLYSEGRPAWILDAKRPDAELIKSKHAEQAYSYAIHPDVRVRFYALCNGRQLVAYDIHGIAPIFAIDFAEIDQNWAIINSVLCPKNTAHAPQRYFDPDFGTALVNLGSPPGYRWIFPLVQLWEFAKVNEALVTMSTGIEIGGVKHLASFDATNDIFMRVLELTDEENRAHVLERLVPGQLVYSKRPIYAVLDSVIGNPTTGLHDVFVPFEVKDVRPLTEAQYEAAKKLLGDDEQSS